jgi:hypothetical protein
MSERLNLEELQELEKLLLILEYAQPESVTPVVAPEPSAPAQMKEKSEKPREPKSDAIEPVRDFIDRICGEGSDKPSGKMLGKDGWMG